MKSVRYILLDTNNEPATSYDQADNEHEIAAPSLSRLIDEIAEYEDWASDSVLEVLAFDGTLTLPSGQYKIKREEFEVLDLQDGDVAEVGRLRREAGIEEDDTRRETTAELRQYGIYDEN